MAGVGILLVWLGYGVFYYGLDQVTGGNDPFLSLVWPGRYGRTPRDGADTGPSPTAGQLNQSGLGAPPGVVTSGPGAGAVVGQGNPASAYKAPPPVPGNPLQTIIGNQLTGNAGK